MTHQTKHLPSLLLFLLHQSGIVFIKRFNQLQYISCPNQDGEQTSYTINPSTTIFLTESIKSIINLTVLAILSCRNPLPRHRLEAQKTLRADVACEILHFFLPAFLYTVQNHLLYVGLKELDTPIYLITSQLKILTTAVASVLILKKKYKPKQWMALLLLTVGVTVVQLEPGHHPHHHSIATQSNRSRGIYVMILSSVLSGVAACWFEKYLKNGQRNPRVVNLKNGSNPGHRHQMRRNLWEKNLKLSSASVVISFLTVYIHPESRSHVQRFGLFSGYHYGYSSRNQTCDALDTTSSSSTQVFTSRILGLSAWFVVIYYSIGGILVSVLVNQFDSITKNFATCLSVIGKLPSIPSPPYLLFFTLYNLTCPLFPPFFSS